MTYFLLYDRKINKHLFYFSYYSRRPAKFANWFIVDSAHSTYSLIDVSILWREEKNNLHMATALKNVFWRFWNSILDVSLIKWISEQIQHRKVVYEYKFWRKCEMIMNLNVLLKCWEEIEMSFFVICLTIKSELLFNFHFRSINRLRI